MLVLNKFDEAGVFGWYRTSTHLVLQSFAPHRACLKLDRSGVLALVEEIRRLARHIEQPGVPPVLPLLQGHEMLQIARMLPQAGGVSFRPGPAHEGVDLEAESLWALAHELEWLSHQLELTHNTAQAA